MQRGLTSRSREPDGHRTEVGSQSRGCLGLPKRKASSEHLRDGLMPHCAQASGPLRVPEGFDFFAFHSFICYCKQLRPDSILGAGAARRMRK